jgi:hypothetical protein
LKLPKLEILPVQNLLLHEWHDDQRAIPLSKRLENSGVLRNPPIVSPLSDGSGRYMVLDGANRTTALKQMNYPHTLCQVVAADRVGLQLKKWNHVLWGWEPGSLLSSISAIPDTTLREIDANIRRPQRKWPEKTLIWLQTPDQRAYVLRSKPSDLTGRAEILAQVAETYVTQAKLDRTTAQRISEINESYQELTAVIVYPPFSIDQILKLCASGILLPPGVTRFTISPRALRLNYPLERLREKRPIEDKNAELEQWISHLTDSKGIRYYSEPTVLFDE